MNTITVNTSKIENYSELMDFKIEGYIKANYDNIKTVEYSMFNDGLTEEDYSNLNKYFAETDYLNLQ